MRSIKGTGYRNVGKDVVSNTVKSVGSWFKNQQKQPLPGKTYLRGQLVNMPGALFEKHKKKINTAKVGKVMHEFKSGSLHSGSKKGPKVTNRKQAIAIAISEAKKGKKRKKKAMRCKTKHKHSSKCT